MGCESFSQAIKPVDGRMFTPRFATEDDKLRSLLVQQEEPLKVVALTGEIEQPDLVMVCGESVVKALPEIHRELGQGITALAFGAEQGDLEQV